MVNRSNAIRRESFPKVNTVKRPIKVIGHIHPDTDVWACIWLLNEHYMKKGYEQILIEFIPAGTRLAKDDPDWDEYEIIHVDTGGGKYDQHEKELEHTSSFELVAKDLGYTFDPAVQKLLPMVNNADNAKAVEDTSIHYFFTALPYSLKENGKKFGKPDWNAVMEQVMFVLQTVASKWRSEARAAERFSKNAVVKVLSNGLKFCALINEPSLRHAAYEHGADVVAWTSPTKGGFYPAIQVNSNSVVDLTPLIKLLRIAEAKERGVDVSKLDLEQFSQVDDISGWFLHDSRRLIGCGTKTHPLVGEELTKIEAPVFMAIVCEALAGLKFDTVRQAT